MCKHPLKGTVVSGEQSGDVNSFMRMHWIAHHPEWCRRCVDGNVKQRFHAHVDVDVLADSEYAYFTDRKMKASQYAGVVKHKGERYQARCTHCARIAVKLGACGIPGASGYTTPKEAAIAYGKHVHGDD
jgi:hypothetical protein